MNIHRHTHTSAHFVLNTKKKKWAKECSGKCVAVMKVRVSKDKMQETKTKIEIGK